MCSIDANCFYTTDTADSSDHLDAAQAIVKGILARHSKERPGYYIHISGTGILCWKDTSLQLMGEAPHQAPYNDLEDVSALTNLPDSAVHRDVDKVVLEAGTAHPDIVKTAIVCPPTIYGPGRGPGNKRSKQVYSLANATLKSGKAPQLGTGLTEWDHVHVHDLSDLLVLLVEAAVGNKSDIANELWGEKGYFLAESGYHVWGVVAKQVAEAAYKAGYIPKPEVETVSADRAKELAGFEALSWGLNSKGFAKRARKFLGWSPKGRSLEAEIPEIVDGEAKLLGLKKSHKEKVSGSE
jgi:nucleoside-diphosphate-sugar epimerase